MKSRDLTNKDDVKIAQNGQLSLVMATKNHEGREWKCLASNSEGNINVEKKMNVKVKLHVKGTSCSYFEYFWIMLLVTIL